MSNRIEINCKKVYDSGKEYLNYCDEIIGIQKDLDVICYNVDEIWNGVDDKNFVISFKKHIQNLDLIINFLGSNGELFKNTALRHGGIDDNFATQMERSDVEDEY